METPQEKSWTSILLQIKGEVGETKGSVSSIRGDLQAIKSRLDQTIPREDCTARHRILEEALARELSAVRTDFKEGIRDLKADLKRSPTSQGYQSITPQMLAAAAAAPPHELTPEEMEAALAARAEERAEKQRKKISWLIGTASALIGLLSILGAATWKIVTTLERVNETLVSQPQVVLDEVKKAESKQRVVYVHTPVPDVKSPAPISDEPSLQTTPHRAPTKKAVKKGP